MKEKGHVAFGAIEGELDWWQRDVIYQVYPRSFQDSTGDGVGDLRGILSRLDYLAGLGIGAVWLSPMYTSPMKDHGYDIADFCDVDPVFGTLQDFDDLVMEIHKRNMKIILDYVPNHTSDLHPWFKASKLGGQDNPYRDFYVWHEGKVLPGGTRAPPNNWISKFGGPAWEWVEERQQWYYHQYVKEQPDLNWRNPQVVHKMQEVLEFWLERGVDGFRVDAIASLYETQDLRQDEPRSNNPTATPEQCNYLKHIHTRHQPETYRAVQEWRRFFDKYETRTGRHHIYMVVELYDRTMKHSIPYYDYGADYPFNFNLTSVTSSADAKEIFELVDGWLTRMPAGKWPNWVLGNHDRRRIADRKGPLFTDAFNTLLLLLPGTPTTYQGEELGMRDVEVPFDLVQDPWAKNFGKERYTEFCRDPSRAPMQWSADRNAGFSSSETTWLPIHPDYKTRNAKIQEGGSSGSHLKMYKTLIKLRQNPSFASGDLRYNVITENIFSFVRYKPGSNPYLVILHFGQSPCTEDYSIDIDNKRWTEGEVVLHGQGVSHLEGGGPKVELQNLLLKPGDALVIRVC